MNQKRCSLVLIGFLLVSFLVGIVSAAGNSAIGDSSEKIRENVGNIISNVVAVFNPISIAVLGATPEQANSQYFFARVVFLLLLVLIIYLALYKVPFFQDYTSMSWIIAIAVAILAMRFAVDDSWIQAILLPYETMGVAISAGLPFVIYFLVVNMGGKNTVPLFRKTAWIFFAVIFMGLWFTRTNITDQAIWIYPVTAGLAVLVAFFDGTINRFWTRADIQKARNESRLSNVRALKRQLAQLDEDIAKGVITRTDYLREQKELHNRIRAIQKGGDIT
jgi:hypothetical protein